MSSGTTWTQLQSGGPSAHLERLIAAQAATANPTAAATATATGGGSTGGLLAAGTYYFVFTESNGIGETAVSPEGAQLTVGATNIPRFTFPTLKAGNAARRLYLGVVGGPSGGPYKLYASGITTTTFDAAVAVPTNSYAVGPPAVNQTSLTFAGTAGGTVNLALRNLRAAERGNLQDVYKFLMDATRNFVQGEPMNWESAMMKVRHAHVTFAALAALCAEIGNLMDANPGTLKSAVTPIGANKDVRVWP